VASLTVRGDAVRAASPDEVRLRLTLSALRPTPKEALDDVASRSELLRTILTDLQIDPSSRSTTDISLEERRDYERGAYHHRGYEASTTVSVRLGDPATAEIQQLVARLVGDAVSQTDARLEGPWWHILLDNPARSEARTEAAREARARAEDYAAALNVRLGPIIEIREPGTHRRRDHGFGADAFVSAATDAPPPSLKLETGDLDVHAAVEVTFALEPG
jgi:uncharacterized protein